MKASARKMQDQIIRQAADAEFDVALRHFEASSALAKGDYSAAATACHRAHQAKLVAAALDKAAKR